MGKITGTDIAPFCMDPRPIGLTIPQIKEVLEKLGLDYKKSAPRDELLKCLPNEGRDYAELSNAARNLLIQKISDSVEQDPWQKAQAEKEQRQFSYMPQIQRGNSLEPAARAFYEKKTGLTITQVGMVTSDDDFCGMSPDGLIAAEGIDLTTLTFGAAGDIRKGLEIKCPEPATHRRWLADHYGKGTIPGDHFYQCQMGMVVCECEEWDFLSFCTQEAPLLVTLKRSSITDQLADGLNVLREERAILDEFYGALWDEAYAEEGRLLLSYHNGAPMFDAQGMPLNDRGEYLLAITGREG